MAAILDKTVVLESDIFFLLIGYAKSHYIIRGTPTLNEIVTLRQNSNKNINLEARGIRLNWGGVEKLEVIAK